MSSYCTYYKTWAQAVLSQPNQYKALDFCFFFIHEATTLFFTQTENAQKSDFNSQQNLMIIT